MTKDEERLEIEKVTLERSLADMTKARDVFRERMHELANQLRIEKDARLVDVVGLTKQLDAAQEHIGHMQATSTMQVEIRRSLETEVERLSAADEQAMGNHALQWKQAYLRICEDHAFLREQLK